jgi:hypothetical protein
MDDVDPILGRAKRLVDALPGSRVSFDRLHDLRRRRARSRQVLTAVVALSIGAAGTLVVLVAFGGLHEPDRNGIGSHPSGGVTVPTSSPSPPVGHVEVRMINGEPAQRVGSFWFGLTGDGSCLRVKPLAVGPSWTLGDESHDCVGGLGNDVIVEGRAAGTIHRDGSSSPLIRYSAVYGRVNPSVASVDVVWADGVVSATVSLERFFLVRVSSEQPTSLVARSADGKVLGRVTLTQP